VPHYDILLLKIVKMSRIVVILFIFGDIIHAFRLSWRIKIVLGIVLLILSLLDGKDAHAQGGELEIIQFSGVVLRPDSTGGVLGVHVYVPKAGRGTTTNQFGYFSMPTLVGDSVVISAIGYQKQHFIVPRDQGDAITVIIPLKEDTIILPEIEVFPYPTEELLKEAILAMRLPNARDYNAINQNLNEQIMAEMFRTMPMDGSQNYKYYMNQRLTYWNDAIGPRYNALLNPLAWADFFKSLKRGDLKKK